MNESLDHRAALARIDPARKATLTARSDRAGLRHLALHLGAIALLAAPIGLALPFWPLALLPLGIALVFLFTLSHECTHQTPFKTPWINEVVGHAVSLPLLLPFTWFRYFHLAHHKHTNDPLHDPELAGGPRPETWPAFFLYLSGWTYWKGMAKVLWDNAFGAPDASYLPARARPQIRKEARLLLTAYLLLAMSLAWSPLLLWLWIVPVLLGQPFLRLYLLAEHGRCPPVANMLENSRTTFTNRLVRALAWNMPYHAEHHAYPNVPFHLLPELHQDLAPHLKTTANGYADFTKAYTAPFPAHLDRRAESGQSPRP